LTLCFSLLSPERLLVVFVGRGSRESVAVEREDGVSRHFDAPAADEPHHEAAFPELEAEGADAARDEGPQIAVHLARSHADLGEPSDELVGDGLRDSVDDEAGPVAHAHDRVGRVELEVVGHEPSDFRRRGTGFLAPGSP
jgi:hypothetical protein